MRYLFIGAHPDDIELSCGGTISRMVCEGHSVYLVIMTCSDGRREEEQRKATKVSGATKHIILPYDDGNVNVNVDSIKRIEKIISIVNPDAVFTHYFEDTHQDHRNTAMIVRSATRMLNGEKHGIIYYKSTSSLNFKPNMYVDITKYEENKRDIIKCFSSQIDKFNLRGIDIIRYELLKNEEYGFEQGV